MKKHLSKRILSLLLTLTMVLALVAPTGATGSSQPQSLAFEQVETETGALPRLGEVVPDEAEALNTVEYAQDDMVRVSIVLEDVSTIAMGFSIENIAQNASAMAYRQSLQVEQESMTASIERVTGEPLDVVWNLTLAANLISANVAYGDIEAIKAIPGVAEVVIETRYEPAVVSVDEYDPNMATSSDMIGSGAAWASGYTGAGSRVAIIDTGTDTDHQSFDAGAFEYAIGLVNEKREDNDKIDLMTADDIAAVLSELNIAELVSDASALYLNAKIPFAYNYVDEGYDVTHDNDTQGEHGSHVSGIAAANRYISDGQGGYADALAAVHTQGVAPDAQIITMKVFGKGGGAYNSDYMAAIEDAVILGADSINLSLGSANPGMSSNATYQELLDSLTEAGAVVCISAGNAGTWQANTVYKYLFDDDVSMQTNGSPGSYTNAFTVASVDNTGNTGNFLDFGEELPAVSFTESSYTNDPIATLDTTGTGTAYDFVLFENTGKDGNGNNLLTTYADICKDKVVMVYRGTSSFYEKHEAAREVGAAACIVVNNQSGTINMDLSDSTATIPCISIQQADGESIKELSTTTAVTDNEGNVLYYTGTMIISAAVRSVQGDVSGNWTMSSFSSWGIPGSLELKPEITAPGGNIYSVFGSSRDSKGNVTGGSDQYENMSGTSMASPQVAGMVAVLAQYIRENGLVEKTGKSARFLAQSLLMSTATPIYEKGAYYYSLLNQGAGVANVNDAINAHSFIEMDENANAGAADGKVKVELGDDPMKNGEYTVTFTLSNLTDTASEYAFGADAFTQDSWMWTTERLMYTKTTEIPVLVEWSVDGVALGSEITEELVDLNGDDECNELDAWYILDYVVENYGPDADMAEISDACDLDHDGSITTYDAYLYLYALNTGVITLEANDSVEVTATIRLTDKARETLDLCANGAYIEAYLYARETASEEGVEGTIHSIPVLGFYGDWSAPSMYDVGTYNEWVSGDKVFMNAHMHHLPYLLTVHQTMTNYITVDYADFGGAEYTYYGNPMEEDDAYTPGRNAFSTNSVLDKYVVTVIRNAGNAMWQVTDANTGKLYYRSDDLGAINSAYYSSSSAAWSNAMTSVKLDWNGTDMDGNKLPENTEINVSLVLAPEYYASEDGTYDWDVLTNGVLGEGAYMTTYFAIDDTAPELTELVYDAENGTVTATAGDNRYLAYIGLFQRGGKKVGYYVPNQELDQIGTQDSYTFNVSGIDLTEGGDFFIQMTDYAANNVRYKFSLNENGATTEKVAPTSITLSPTELTLIRGTSGSVSATFEPWLANTSLTWTSADESIATVDENGTITGVGVGSTTITATSAVDSTVFDTCTVTVKTYNVTLTGALQDEDGNPELFTWNLETDDTWTKTNDLDSNVNAIAYDFLHENVMYQMSTNGMLHQVNTLTGETLGTSDASIVFGYPVDDMEYAGITSQLTGQDTLVGVYAGYFLYSIPAMSNDFSYGWNLSSYLSNYTGSSRFTAISWAGYTTNSSGNTVDVFYCLTNNGYIWLIAPDFTTGDASLNFFATNLRLSYPGYGDTLYCSMAMGDDGNFYLSYFNGETNQIYVLEEEVIYDEDGEVADYKYNAMQLGDVGNGVWPMGLLTVTANGTGEDEGSDANFITLPESMMQVELETETISLPQPESAGSLNAVKANADKLTEDTAVETNGVSVDNMGRIYLDVNAENSANGLVQIAYDSTVLTFEGFEGKYVALTSDRAYGSNIYLAYAANTTLLNDKLGTMVFSYDKNNCPYETDVTITTLQDNDNLEPSEATKLTVELKERIYVTPGIPGGNGGGSGSGSGSGSSSGSTGNKLPYTDVSRNDSYYDAVKYLYDKGIMNGTGDGTVFSPNMTLDRGMVATILYRMAGEPNVAFKGVFSDITSDIYCAKAVEWAAANGIALGCPDGTFKPYEYVTLEQLAAFLSRYAAFKGIDVQDSVLSDTANVSDWAKADVAWALAKGIFTAEQTENAVRNATRAEVAVAVYTYITKVAK